MPTAKTTAVYAVIAVQVAVPLVALFDVRPTSFGFQMYSVHGYVEVDAVDVDGRPVDVDVDGMVAGPLRATLDWTDGLAQHVCARVPAAAQVTVEQQEWSGTVQCD